MRASNVYRGHVRSGAERSGAERATTTTREREEHAQAREGTMTMTRTRTEHQDPILEKCCTASVTSPLTNLVRFTVVRFPFEAQPGMSDRAERGERSPPPPRRGSVRRRSAFSFSSSKHSTINRNGREDASMVSCNGTSCVVVAACRVGTTPTPRGRSVGSNVRARSLAAGGKGHVNKAA